MPLDLRNEANRCADKNLKLKRRMTLELPSSQTGGVNQPVLQILRFAA